MVPLGTTEELESYATDLVEWVTTLPNVVALEVLVGLAKSLMSVGVVLALLSVESSQ